MTPADDVPPPSSANTPSIEHLHQAADWYARLRAAPLSADLHQQWRSWLAADARHQRAWDGIESASRHIQPTGGSQPNSMLAVHARRHGRQRRCRRIRIFFLTLLLGLGGAAGWFGSQSPRGQAWLAARGASLHTGIGEIRPFSLPDGQQLWLDTATAVNTSFTPQRQQLQVLTGTILIEGPNRSGRTLEIEAGRWRLFARNARLQVSLLPHGLQIDVYQGSALLRLPGGGQNELVAGKRYTQASSAAPLLTQPLPDNGDAWTRGLLIAEDMPLADLVDILGRYRLGYLDLAPDVAQVRVGGNFPLLRQDIALGLLAQTQQVRVKQRLPGWTIIAQPE